MLTLTQSALLIFATLTAVFSLSLETGILMCHFQSIIYMRLYTFPLCHADTLKPINPDLRLHHLWNRV